MKTIKRETLYIMLKTMMASYDINKSQFNLAVRKKRRKDGCFSQKRGQRIILNKYLANSYCRECFVTIEIGEIVIKENRHSFYHFLCFKAPYYFSTKQNRKLPLSIKLYEFFGDKLEWKAI